MSELESRIHRKDSRSNWKKRHDGIAPKEGEEEGAVGWKA
jgi:hypothetical protein